jgi:outer membrane protein TolC
LRLQGSSLKKRSGMRFLLPSLLVALVALVQTLGCSARCRPGDAFDSLLSSGPQDGKPYASSQVKGVTGQYAARPTSFIAAAGPSLVGPGLPAPAVEQSQSSGRSTAWQPGESVALPPARFQASAQAPAALPIDLPTALRLADAENLQVSFAREQVRQALARVDAAQSLWLPSLRGGMNYNRHEGAIQQVLGQQSDTSRSAFYAGAGAGAYGAASPVAPGVYANFQLADALFQPLAARQFASSRRDAAVAATHDVLLRVALAYLEVLRASDDLRISLAARDDAQRLAYVTAAYANSGEGLESDANRSRTELAIRTNDVARAQESVCVA